MFIIFTLKFPMVKLSFFFQNKTLDQTKTKQKTVIPKYIKC